MGYSTKNCYESSSTEALKNHRERGKWITNIIESKRVTEKERAEKTLRNLNNQAWIIKLIRMLEKEFQNESDLFSLLECKLFMHWGKYESWRKRENNPNITSECSTVYFMRTFSLVHMDVKRLKEELADEITERVFKVVLEAYSEYEKITGMKIHIHMVK